MMMMMRLVLVIYIYIYMHENGLIKAGIYRDQRIDACMGVAEIKKKERASKEEINEEMEGVVKVRKRIRPKKAKIEWCKGRAHN